VANVHRHLLAQLPNFIVRVQQKQMMTAALRLFTSEQVGLVEAPTGTGKSLGYLLPGLATAQLDKRTLVVSTATASLQDQLAKDIPTLSDAFVACGGQPIRMAVAKGRERHVCPLRLDDATGTQDMFNGQEDAGLNQAAKLFESKVWNGLRDTAPVNFTAEQWRRINNTSTTCTGKRCHLYEDCPYYKTQEAIREAHVVITNHDYLLTCLAHTPSSPLSQEGTIYVFDEAHHLGTKLLSVFSRRLDFGAFPVDLLTSILSSCAEHRRSVEIAAELTQEKWRDAERLIEDILGLKGIHRFPMGMLSAEVKDVLQALLKAVNMLHGHLEKAKESLRRMKSTAPKSRSTIIDLADINLSQLIGEIAQFSMCLSDLCAESEIARWIAKGAGPTICCSPFDASSMARRHLWPVVKSALLTSATLTSMGSFSQSLRELGLSSETPTLKLTSPFDYTKARVVVPKLVPDGTDKSHGRLVRAFVAEKGVRANAHAGVLVYFTSKRLMHECYDYLTAEEKELVLLQGAWQPSAMIAEHRRRIDAGRRSIVFGMDSLGEGVDLPGHYCTLVLVSRLPFPSPDDPVVATHAEYLAAKGLDFFQLLTLPKASLKLAQVCGRLMRREGDWGDIVVLDRRIVSKRYGPRMLKGTEFKTVHAG
jgi:ATP-dependent DNA helicase DinG